MTIEPGMCLRCNRTIYRRDEDAWKHIASGVTTCRVPSHAEPTPKPPVTDPPVDVWQAHGNAWLRVVVSSTDGSVSAMYVPPGEPGHHTEYVRLGGTTPHQVKGPRMPFLIEDTP
jgi:hypothetical protein